MSEGGNSSNNEEKTIVSSVTMPDNASETLTVENIIFDTNNENNTNNAKDKNDEKKIEMLNKEGHNKKKQVISKRTKPKTVSFNRRREEWESCLEHQNYRCTKQQPKYDKKNAKSFDHDDNNDNDEKAKERNFLRRILLEDEKSIAKKDVCENDDRGVGMLKESTHTTAVASSQSSFCAGDDDYDDDYDIRKFMMDDDDDDDDKNKDENKNKDNNNDNSSKMRSSIGDGTAVPPPTRRLTSAAQCASMVGAFSIRGIDASENSENLHSNSYDYDFEYREEDFTNTSFTESNIPPPLPLTSLISRGQSQASSVAGGSSGMTSTMMMMSTSNHSGHSYHSERSNNINTAGASAALTTLISMESGAANSVYTTEELDNLSQHLPELLRRQSESIAAASGNSASNNNNNNNNAPSDSSNNNSTTHTIMNSHLLNNRVGPIMTADMLQDKLGGPPRVQHGHFSQLSNEKLVVAREVVEDEDDDDNDENLPEAIEYDPDMKPPMYKNRRFGLYGIGVSIVFIIILIFIVIYSVTTANNNNTNNSTTKDSNNMTIITTRNTIAPTTYRDTIGIQEIIIKGLMDNSDRFRDKESAEYKALNWIINEDPMQLLPTSKNLFQRYLLAYFYFHTSEKGPWNSCNRPIGKQRDTCTFKHTIIPSDERDDVRGQVRWLSKRPECEWARNTCDEDGNVIDIWIMAQKLSGTFPSEIVKLTSLRELNLAYNQLSGRLPSELSRLKSLYSISLQANYFTGTIPKQWYALPNITDISVGENNIMGTIPSEFVQMGTLQKLQLYSNQFYGTIPPEIFKLPLWLIDIQNNNLEGTIPTEVGLCTTLETFHISDNAFVGTLPSEIGSNTLISWFRMDNTQLSGTIPDEIYNLKHLDRLYLRGSNFSGTISTKIGQLSDLVYLSLEDNALTGTVPTEIGNLNILRWITLQGNKFSGNIPNEMCALFGPERLRDFWADCSPTTYNGLPAMECACCSVCCNRYTSMCEDNL